jgi:hypothetical protein
MPESRPVQRHRPIRRMGLGMDENRIPDVGLEMPMETGGTLLQQNIIS